MKLTGRTRVYALVGHPVAHSRSPEIYNPLFAEHDVDAVYVAFDVAPSAGPQLGALVRTLGLAGVNLTIPFKADILEALDRIDPVAQALGAVNVVVREGEQLVGYNTDASGFRRGLIARFGEVVAGARVLVLGAGGAGRAVGMGLGMAGAAEVIWLNRDQERAAEAVWRAAALNTDTRFSADVLESGAFARYACTADLVVQCTSGPGVGLVAGFDVDLLPGHAIWCDINYWMTDPPLVRACRERGLRVQEGLDMLVFQAVEAFELFTGITADPLPIFQRLG